jgi:uncharacterized membrane protein
MANLMHTGLIASAVAAALAGGATFAFSNFVMPALNRLAAPEATRAMQAINETAINPLFMLLLIGTGLLSIAASVAHLMSLAPTNYWLLVGAALYVCGVVLVTVAGNVPLNETLAQADSTLASPDAWDTYARPWTTWNHVRTLAAAAASTAFILAALQG